ncbi:MAG TPA: nucleotidyl transferase AbiEii/AbiGii toxin family protein [Candidatus Nanoarchaeia archaeon]|nr:nucleotidyl transferase AbiEii/AbiGii toxin family protein [Candidatus Nanoarchaeia archaeon]
MVSIPLQTKLKRESHRKIAYAQDLVVKEVYSVFDKAVLHGGTAIWRCYSGRRFSEDLDFYLPHDHQEIGRLFENLKKIGFEVKRKKISETSVYSELVLDRAVVRLEATFQKITGVLCDYELSDGNRMIIYSLTPESFLIEKCITYLKRFKIRDLWDIFFLLKLVENPEAIKELGILLKEYTKPVDEEDLQTIVLEGVVPSADEMMEYIRRKWENKYI